MLSQIMCCTQASERRAENDDIASLRHSERFCGTGGDDKNGNESLARTSCRADLACVWEGDSEECETAPKKRISDEVAEQLSK